MSLNNPDARRALRSVVQAVIVLVLVGFLGWLIELLSASAPDLSRIAMALCGIVGLFVALVGAENVGRVMVEFGAAKAEIGKGDDAP